MLQMKRVAPKLIGQYGGKQVHSKRKTVKLIGTAAEKVHARVSKFNNHMGVPNKYGGKESRKKLAAKIRSWRKGGSYKGGKGLPTGGATY